MKVEHYSEKYRADVTELIREFHAQYLQDVDKEIYGENINETIDKFSGDDADKSFLLIDGDKCVGVIAGIEMKSYLNNHRIYSEIFWFVGKNYGMFAPWFVSEVEKMLKEQGFSVIVMAVLASDKSSKLKKMYEAMEYKYLECHYMKGL
jgi:hypothetical protein